jgi:uncharacterized protein (DUF952 family)
MRILHIASRDEWAQAKQIGEYTRSTADASLAEVGFVHLSTASQFPGVIDRFYADVDLSSRVLLVVDTEACVAAGSAFQWDYVESQGSSFPHLYGPIPASAVVAELPISRDAAGRVQGNGLAALDVVPVPPEVVI